MEIIDLRKMAGIKRSEMCKRYGIPVRTAQDWENGKGNAPQYVKDLLERAIRQDYGFQATYYVTEYDDQGNEWVLLKTMNKLDALERADRERCYHERDKVDKMVEVRLYKEDVEADDCTCFDYDVIE